MWRWYKASYKIASGSWWLRRWGCFSHLWRPLKNFNSKVNDCQFLIQLVIWVSYWGILADIEWGANLWCILSEPHRNAPQKTNECGLRLKDKHIISNICAHLKLFVNAVIKAVVLFVIFALVQRVVLHVLGQRCLHFKDVYAWWSRLICFSMQYTFTYVAPQWWLQLQS